MTREQDRWLAMSTYRYKPLNKAGLDTMAAGARSQLPAWRCRELSVPPSSFGLASNRPATPGIHSHCNRGSALCWQSTGGRVCLRTASGMRQRLGPGNRVGFRRRSHQTLATGKHWNRWVWAKPSQMRAICSTVSAGRPSIEKPRRSPRTTFLGSHPVARQYS